MPSQAMQDLIGVFRDAAQASASRAPAPLEERRAAFAPAGRLHPVPDDVLVTANGWRRPAQATERIGKFLRARVYSWDSPRQL